MSLTSCYSFFVRRPILSSLSLLLVLACGSSDAASTGPGGTDDKDAGALNGNPVNDPNDAGSDARGDDGGKGCDDSFAPCASAWHQDISGLTAATESATLVPKLPTSGLHVSLDHHVLTADGSTPTAVLGGTLSPDSDTGAIPVPAGGAVQGENGYVCSGSTDCRLLVVKASTHQVFEALNVNSNGSTWTADSFAVWDTRRDYGSAGRGASCASADTAGLPVTAGLVRVVETKNDAIGHALRIGLPASAMRSERFVAPATHARIISSGADPAGLPFGTRLRLRATFDESSIPSSGGKAVAHALKKYGAFVVEVTSAMFIDGESDQFPKSADAANAWTGTLATSDLTSITGADFEVVQFGTIQTQSDCSRIP